MQDARVLDHIWHDQKLVRSSCSTHLACLSCGDPHGQVGVIQHQGPRRELLKEPGVLQPDRWSHQQAELHQNSPLAIQYHLMWKQAA
jgi:hypothetical protein